MYDTTQLVFTREMSYSLMANSLRSMPNQKKSTTKERLRVEKKPHNRRMSSNRNV